MQTEQHREEYGIAFSGNAVPTIHHENLEGVRCVFEPKRCEARQSALSFYKNLRWL